MDTINRTMLCASSKNLATGIVHHHNNAVKAHDAASPVNIIKYASGIKHHIRIVIHT